MIEQLRGQIREKRACHRGVHAHCGGYDSAYSSLIQLSDEFIGVRLRGAACVENCNGRTVQSTFDVDREHRGCIAARDVRKAEPVLRMVTQRQYDSTAPRFLLVS